MTPPASGGEAARQRDIVVIGASAGGVEALGTLTAGLPAELGASVFVVLHVMSGGKSVLPQILSRKCALTVAAADDGEEIERGQVYVAPPDHHMLIADGHVRLTHGPRENGHRPAVDPLFRSAARAFGRRVIGVVLSGALDDGTAGLRMICEAGGVALVQDPAGALYPSMPASALEHTPQARAVPLGQLADAICAAIDEPLGEDEPPSGNPIKSSPVAEPDRSDDDPRAGVLTALTCPECGGALWEHDEHGVIRFKCHVGHAYSSESLEASQAESLEGALWAGLRSLQERADLFNRLARRGRANERMREKAKVAEGHASVLRALVTSFGAEPGDAGEVPPPGARLEQA
ncbi:MAG TPA: chemotaxis protein CheB [Solirubrobacteraceae bacterium]|nr:chemotaxis protein CheB [Solirubrobacteraceae bacterium]